MALPTVVRLQTRAPEKPSRNGSEEEKRGNGDLDSFIEAF
jgi:hypothetical protein